MKIGIITMHRVNNNGSVLQAFALQYAINLLGYDAELIDYDFNAGKPKRKKVGIMDVVNWLLQLILGFPQIKREKKFEKFHRDYLKHSAHEYLSRISLHNNPPVYDVYCTGSDQVWNPRFIFDDTSFMLSFVPANKPKISYAASFATNKIPNELLPLYKKYLGKYDQITVREFSNVKLVSSLINKEATVVCDPTLLLSKNDWIRALNIIPVKNKEPYILVYILSYMYNPYPNVYNIINYVREKLGYKVVFLGGKVREAFRVNASNIRDEGPLDFINLFMNASFVITDSFHGSAFSCIFEKPLLGVVKSLNTSDGRLLTLLKTVGAEDSIISYKDEITMTREKLMSLRCDSVKLSSYRSQSMSMLTKMLEKYN